MPIRLAGELCVGARRPPPTSAAGCVRCDISARTFRRGMGLLAAEKPYSKARPELWPHQPKLRRRRWPTARKALRIAAAAGPGVGATAAQGGARHGDGRAGDATKVLGAVATAHQIDPRDEIAADALRAPRIGARVAVRSERGLGRGRCRR